MLYKSIRWRIQAWHGVLLVCLVTGMLGAFYLYARADRYRAVDNRLHPLLTVLLPRVNPPHGMDSDGGGPPPEGEREGRPDFGPGPENRLEGVRREVHLPEVDDGSFYFTAWLPDGGLKMKSADAPEIPQPVRDKAGESQFFRTRGGYRELVYFGPDGSSIVVGGSTAQVAHEMGTLALTLVAVGLGLIGFGLAGGWWVAGHALRPIGEMSAAARQISSGDHNKRMDARDTESELGQLAEVLNRAFDQQDRALKQQVRFTADASHELRTPLTVILTQLQLALSRERSAEEYRESMNICLRAGERMRGLVNSLLDLARIDAGEFRLKVKDCDLGAMAKESLELIAPLAKEKNAVLLSSIESVQTKADSSRLSQVIVNLLHNAIRHNPQGVEVNLTVRREGNDAVFRVADNGNGIPAAALPHVFERFYRGDKSRTGANNGNGTGLGLAICQAIVAAHGGSIRAENQAERGAVFTVILPLAN